MTTTYKDIFTNVMIDELLMKKFFICFSGIIILDLVLLNHCLVSILLNAIFDMTVGYRSYFYVFLEFDTNLTPLIISTSAFTQKIFHLFITNTIMLQNCGLLMFCKDSCSYDT